MSSNDYADYRDLAAFFSKSMRCNCDLDNWQPERRTGHSCVCRIHKAVVGVLVLKRDPDPRPVLHAAGLTISDEVTDGR